MSLRPKPEIERLPVCPHGGINYGELRDVGFNPDEVLDFSVSSNPFMPPPGIKEALKTIAIERYPDSEAMELRERIAENEGVSPQNIITGSGTTELLRLIALTYFRKRDPVLILEPTYGDYDIACRIVGARPVKHRVREEDNFSPNMEDVARLIVEKRPRGIIICNPNNPTGKYLSREKIEMILKVLGDSLLIIDEAYIAFVERAWNSIDLTARGNVVILRSMTKDYGLTGLRLGYAIAPQSIVDNLRRACPPWNVNIIAQKAGVIALSKADFLEQTKKKIKEAKQFLVKKLVQLGYEVLPSHANFFLVKVGNASEFRATLLKRGILVRDCTSFGLPEYVRIAPRTMPECEKLIDAIAEGFSKSRKQTVR
ncbi:pyridoxal phosphate-dependent aminotransferase [Chloroflexota bacterium]